jgi:glyoxylase-like metal-dependent hydrolase (beta-lactamase superfamily II)
MNSTLLLDRAHTIVVDPGVLPSELDDLERIVKATAPAAVTLVFTHGDWDHVLGRPWWPAAFTLAHDAFAAEVRGHRQQILDATVAAVATEGESWDRGFEPFRPRSEVSGLRFQKLGPWRVVTRDALGHSATMLSIHLPEQRLLIAGDMLSDIEIPTLAASLPRSIQRFRETLLELVPLAEHGAIERVVPGHGSIALDREVSLARLKRDLEYLDELAHRVGAAVRRGLSVEETVNELDAMPYLGKRAEYSMVDAHRSNVRIAHGEIAAAVPEPRS